MIWSCFKNKSNYLFYYGKSPLPQGCHNPSIIEQQQLWCSAWMIKALAIEILPAMVSAYQGVLHQLTSFSRSYCTSGISGSNVLGVSWQWQYLPFMYPNTFKKRRKKKNTDTLLLIFPTRAKIFCLNAFPLKPAWILFQRNFLWAFLEIWRLHEAQYA